MSRRRTLPSKGQLAAHIFPSAGLLFLLLTAWEWLVGPTAMDLRLVPQPTQIWQSLIEGFSEGVLLSATGISLRRFVLGIVIAFLISVPAGLALGSSPLLRDAFYPVVKALYPIPVAALIPVLLVLFGVTDSLYISVIGIAVAIPITMSTVDAVQRADVIQIETARTLGASRRHVFLKVLLPSVLPKVLHAAYVAFSLGLIVLTTAEILVSTSGLGNFLVLSQRQFRVSDMYSGIIVIGMLGVAQAAFVRRVNTLLVGWEEQSLAKRW